MTNHNSICHLPRREDGYILSKAIIEKVDAGNEKFIGNEVIAEKIISTSYLHLTDCIISQLVISELSDIFWKNLTLVSEKPCKVINAKGSVELEKIAAHFVKGSTINAKYCLLETIKATNDVQLTDCIVSQLVTSELKNIFWRNLIFCPQKACKLINAKGVLKLEKITAHFVKASTVEVINCLLKRIDATNYVQIVDSYVMETISSGTVYIHYGSDSTSNKNISVFKKIMAQQEALLKDIEIEEVSGPGHVCAINCRIGKISLVSSIFLRSCTVSEDIIITTNNDCCSLYLYNSIIKKNIIFKYKQAKLNQTEILKKRTREGNIKFPHALELLYEGMPAITVQLFGGKIEGEIIFQNCYGKLATIEEDPVDLSTKNPISSDYFDEKMH